MNLPTIHVREPYDFDLRIFGIRDGDQLLTPPEYWQRHTSRAVDFVIAKPYTVDALRLALAPLAPRH